MRAETQDYASWQQLHTKRSRLHHTPVSRYFKPSQPQKTTSGLRETFMKRYIVERTNKEEIKREEQCEKAESYQENLRNEIH